MSRAGPPRVGGTYHRAAAKHCCAEFTIKGTENCLARGYDRTGFFEVDTGEQRAWTVQLTEANEQPAQRVPGIPGTVGPGGPGGVPGLSNPPSGPGLPPAAAPKQ